jgi:hypothetical protein
VKIDMSFGNDPDMNIAFPSCNITLDLQGQTASDDECREMAEALRTTPFVANYLGSPAQVYITSITQTDLTRPIEVEPS